MRREMVVLAALMVACLLMPAASGAPSGTDPSGAGRKLREEPASDQSTLEPDVWRTVSPDSELTVDPDSTGAGAIGWLAVDPNYAWSFPRDHGTHPGFRNEWWYFVGHLYDATGRRFGYQLTLFRIGIAPTAPRLDSWWTASDLVMGHLAVTDVAGDRHLFAETLYRATPLLGGFGAADSVLAWSQAPPGTHGRWSIRWNAGRFELSARDERTGVAVELSAAPLEEPLLQGPNGYSRKSGTEEAASHYYSVTRLETRGSITVPASRDPDPEPSRAAQKAPPRHPADASSRMETLEAAPRGATPGRPLASPSDVETLEAGGISWMDHEFSSNQLGAHQVGWDWFALQLADGRDLMLYMLRDAEGVDYAHGTLREASGAAHPLEPKDWRLDARRAQGELYPSRWNLEIPEHDIEVEIVPLVLDQENVSAILPDLRYWEGAVEVRAQERAWGQGYVELTGYGESGRLPF